MQDNSVNAFNAQEKIQYNKFLPVLQLFMALKHVLFYSGEPLKIHISAQTKDILDMFGNFLIIPRGNIEIKVRKTVCKLFLNIKINNYLLVFRERVK